MEPEYPRHVVVLGGGPAGLATAHELSVRGARVTVLERNDYVGGLCRTAEYKGYRFDLGGHRWFTKNEDLNRWFRRLMEGEIVHVERISRIYHDGKFYSYPIRFGDIIKNTDPLTIVHAGLSFQWAAIQYSLLNKKIANIRDAFTSQFGAKLFDMFFRNYTEKVWGKPCEELSADWVTQRSQGLSISTVVRDALMGNREKMKSLIEEFMYPQDGYMRIPERMAEDVESYGNDVRLGAAVKDIEYHGPNDLEVCYESGQQSHSIRADHVVSTIPLGLLARSMRPVCDEAVVQAAKGLEFRDLITVNLIINRPQVSPDTWLYIQDKEVIFGRMHEPKNWSPAMVPEADNTSVVLECFCTRGDEIWQCDDAEIANRCIGDMAAKLGFISREEVTDWTVIRTTYAYPVYDLEYADKLAKIRGFLESFQGMHIAGRGGTFRYNNADHSIEMGLLLAREILGMEGDHMSVNTELAYQEILTESEPRREQQFTVSADSA